MREEFGTLGKTILYYRKKAGLTQAQLAERLYTKKSDISEIENDKRSMTIPRLLDIADVSYENYKHDEEQYSYSDKLLCKATPYAIEDRKIDTEAFTDEVLSDLTEKGFSYDSSVVGDEYSAYWLRSSLSWDSWFTAEGHALLVEENGSIKLGTASLKNGKTSKHGIRPCVWVSLENAGKYLSVTTDNE